MNIQASYPLFEADQVLTNDHLNKLSTYLEQQERLTRNKLIGCGIVCGLEITGTGDSIIISKGCALTSQGYYIPVCETSFTCYKPYITKDFMKNLPSGLPDNWPLICQCGVPDMNAIPFYKPAYDQGIFQLFSDEEAKGFDADDTAAIVLLKNTTIKLSDYAVVIFLEAENLDLKNCDTNDCNDKGSLMDFEVKILLVEKKIIDAINTKDDGTSGAAPAVLHSIRLKRYNVETGSNILSAADVLKRFDDLVTDDILRPLADNLKYCWEHYNYLLRDYPTNPFTNLFTDLKATRDDIKSKHHLLIQYFYDFVDDLIKAFWEFKHKVFDVMGECCPDEMRFPFHVMLGEANVSTSIGNNSPYRQYFIYSPLFDSQGKKTDEIRSLFARMHLMTLKFRVSDPYDFQEKALTDFTLKAIKATPGTYGDAYLSSRCIPYYYKVNDKGQELYRYWNYDKTRRGNAAFNLGYNSPLYNTSDLIQNPLLYDIEGFNFFRIEGHIGKNINTALPQVIQLKDRYNLPFYVIALSSDSLGTILKGNEPKCLISDLESDYRLLIAELICKLHQVFCTVSRFAYTPAIFEEAFAKPVADAAQPVLLELGNEAKIMKAVFSSGDIIPDHDSISEMVNEFLAAKNYKKGLMLTGLCAPFKENTIGAVYTKLPGGVIPDKVLRIAFYNPLFSLIDNIESMFLVLLSAELSDLDIDVFTKAYRKFEAGANSLGALQTGWLGQLNNDFDTDYWRNSFMDILHACVVERLTALKEEYYRRIKGYTDAKNFNTYFKKHGGLEHKAGVPAGGTFILVYHEVLHQIVIDPVRNGSLSGLTNSNILLMKEALAKDAPLANRMYLALSKYMESCDDMDDHTKDEIIYILGSRPGKPAPDTIPNQAVIADFYVPYLCCSDCPPVAYVFPSIPLIASVSDPVCDEAGENYSVKINVTGGEPPYTFSMDGATIPGGQDLKFPSGTADKTVNIQDTVGNTTEVTINGHNCCNLPCGGKAERCNYPLWASIPDDKHRISHNFSLVVLKVSDKTTGQNDVVVPNVLPIFEGINGSVFNTKNTFDQAMKEIFSKLSDVVNIFPASGTPAVFSYDDKNQLLVIEKSDCHKLSLELDMILTLNDKRTPLKFVYDTDNGITIQNLANAGSVMTTQVPKFGCIKIDKCAKTETDPCKGSTLNFTGILAQQEAQGKPFYTFTAKPVFDKYFWYFENCLPLYSDSPGPLHIQVPMQAISVFVKVIGIKSATGCFAIFSDTVNLTVIPPPIP